MFKGTTYQLFFILCAIFTIRASQDSDSLSVTSDSESSVVIIPSAENQLTTLSDTSLQAVAFSLKNKSARPLFIVLADGERVQNGSVSRVGRDHADHYGTILNQAFIASNATVDFVITKSLSQATLYLWEGGSLNGGKGCDSSVLSQLGLPIVKKKFDINPTAIFRFNPGNNKGVHLKWRLGQLLPRSKKKKFNRQGYINNIDKGQVRRFDFEVDGSVRPASSSSSAEHSLYHSGLI